LKLAGRKFGAPRIAEAYVLSGLLAGSSTIFLVFRIALVVRQFL
jgi:hypothetical protein